MQRFDFNGIVFSGFLEFVLFDKVGNGYEIYPEGNVYRERHKVLKAKFDELFKYARYKNLKVYLYTDMVAFTPLLRDYFIHKFGKIDVDNPAFWKIYQSGLEELFETMNIDGLMIRIGEAGAIYNKKDWDYSSELFVKTDKSVELMLKSMLQTAEKSNKQIIFRTWSVGIGQIGDMHTNPKTYERVLSNISSPNFIVSTKYCMGDFDSYLPLNPTLFKGKHKRITELQARREFEAFNAFPLYVAPLYQMALREFVSKNPNFDGVWLWTQEGGPLRAGPMSIYPFHGFNLITDLNVYAISRLIQDPNQYLVDITKDWISETFGDDSLLLDTLSLLLLQSHQTAVKGLYIKEFAQWEVRALGLEPPPMLWIFKWDIVGGGSSVLSNIYYISRNNLDSAIDEGYQAVKEAEKYKQMAISVKTKVNKNLEQYNQLIASIDYQINLFKTLAYYRNYFLKYYQWLDSGDKDAYKEWILALDNFMIAYEVHQDKYQGNLDFPAYNFTEALAGIKIAGRSNTMIGLSRLIFILMLFTVFAGLPILQRKYSFYPLKSIGAMFWTALFSPLSSFQKRKGFCIPALGIFWYFLLILSSILVFTSFAAPQFAWLMFTSLSIYIAGLFLLNYKQSAAKSIELVSVLAPIIIILAIVMAFSAIRGPFYFWQLFWVSNSFRLFFISLFVALIFYAYWVLYFRQKRLFELNHLQTIARVLVIQGIQFFALGFAGRWIGLEKSLTALNDELLVLPGGLSRILGITTHLGIPKQIPDYLLLAAAILLVFALLFQIIHTVVKKK
jgi:hypothetical protein